MQQHWLHLDNASTHPDGIHRQLRDPPPLDSRLAKQVLDLMLRFMYHTSNPSSERATFFTHQMYCYCDREFTKGDWADFTVFMSHLHSTNLMTSVYEKACRVIYYISASNWALVFSKIKSSILHLSTTSEATPDTLMLRLLESSSLNARRLSMVLDEVQLSFLSFKKNTQLNLAVLLRRGIWNWVEGYPIEFEDLQLGQKRLDGSPEILFDMCNSLADTTRKKTYFWPLQNMLLMLCPDILTNITLNYSHGNYSKKVTSTEKV
jgi:neurofibromin 1